MQGRACAPVSGTRVDGRADGRQIQQRVIVLVLELKLHILQVEASQLQALQVAAVAKVLRVLQRVGLVVLTKATHLLINRDLCAILAIYPVEEGLCTGTCRTTGCLAGPTDLHVEGV